MLASSSRPEVSVPLLDEVVAGRAPRIEPLSVDQYHRMIETGVLAEGQPLELVDGFVVRKDRSPLGGDAMTHGTRHAWALASLLDLASALKSANLHLRQQAPVALSPRDEPEPDAAIVRGAKGAYLLQHPGPADVVVAIEVSDSSLAYDRRIKQRLYATAGIPAYLIVNLVDDCLELHTRPEPSEGRYLGTTVATPGHELAIPLGSVPALSIAAAELIPPREA